MKTKYQTPTRHQRRSKHSTGAGINGLTLNFRYPVLADRALVFNEPANGKEASKHPFDLEERAAQFGETIVRFSKKIPRDPTNDRLINQLVGCATSIGGSYCDPNDGVSEKDLRHMTLRCVKDAKETKFFLRMLAASEPQLAGEAREHYREASELHLIFANICRKTTGER